MKRRVLFVDDEPNVLEAIRRAIRKEFDVTIAAGPEAGLEAIANAEPFDVIVSDMRMPGMNGVGFLGAAQQLSPSSMRIMLTGNADQQTAIDAVNDGEVYRFLTKPCDIDRLRDVLAQAIYQRDLYEAERALLEDTVKGSLEVMVELLGMARPEAVGRSSRLRSLVADLLAMRADVSNDERRDAETAAMLSQLGSLALPIGLSGRIDAGEPLDEQGEADWQAASLAVAQSLSRIPRMEGVARVLRYQHKAYDGGGEPEDDIVAEALPIGSRALRLASHYELLRARGFDPDEALDALSRRRREFDPRLLAALRDRLASAPARETIEVEPTALAVGMTLAADVCSESGSLLLCEGQRITAAILEHLQRFVRDGDLRSPCTVYAPDR